MWKSRKDKDKLLENIKVVWENDHGEEVTEAYNKIVEVLAKLDIYSANMLVNLLWIQTVKKTFKGTVGKKEVGGE
jgi:hypothetical protein